MPCAKGPLHTDIGTENRHPVNYSVESLTVFDHTETLRQVFSSIKYVKFYDKMLCFSKLDGSLKFQNVPNF